MIKTYGLTHIALAVRDPDESLRFYGQLFGLQEYFRDASSIHARNPNGHEIVTFVRDALTAGRPGGILHFGFRLKAARDIDGAVREIEQAGGRILQRGEFTPGFPFLYAADPNGYEVSRYGLSEGPPDAGCLAMHLTFEPTTTSDAPALAALHTAVAEDLTRRHGCGQWSTRKTEKGGSRCALRGCSWCGRTRRSWGRFDWPPGSHGR